ncbi:MAG TPA: hypothetical protein VFA44_05960 [Gaiellaceae bacterium]|nr:hypothetical protein [Gaiellaceae bacterium]
MKPSAIVGNVAGQPGPASVHAGDAPLQAGSALRVLGRRRVIVAAGPAAERPSARPPDGRPVARRWRWRRA